MKKVLLVLMSLCFTMLLQAQVSKTANATAGNLSTILTATELSSITNLTLTGTIDARDFKTMRDNMPALAVLDLSQVNIATYTGTEGTQGTSTIFYGGGIIPNFAFFNQVTGLGKLSLRICIFSVGAIGDFAFFNCAGLVSFFASSGYLSIGNYAFTGCISLTSISIPSSVVFIGTKAFSGCYGPFSVEAGNTNYFSLDGVLFNKLQTTLIQFPTSKKGNYKIDTSVTTINDGAFLYCSGLTSITIPSSVTSIGSNAFDNCTGLSKIYALASSPVDLSSKTAVFGNVNKTNCTLYVPISAKAAYQAASQWQDFSQIVEQSFKIISISAGSLSTALTATELSTVNNLTLTGTIDARDFKIMRDNMPLLSVVDFSGINIVAYSGTDGTQGTSYYDYPANAVPYHAFFNNITWKGKTSLISVILPSSVTSIGGNAFLGCTGLANFMIPSSVTTIGYGAFNSCSGLVNINIPSSVTSIGSNAFNGSTGLITVDANNLNYSGSNGILFDKGKTLLIQCPVSKTGTYTIPSTVTAIGSDAFGGCTKLTAIGIPSSVTSIGSGSFSVCSGMTTITIPASVKTIESYAFQICSGLNTIYLNSGIPIDLSGFDGVFNSVNKTTCTLYVPFGTKALYAAASQWKDFTNIVEMAEFKLSSTSATITGAGGTAKVDLTTGLAWSAVSDQTWLTVNSSSGTGNQSFNLTATANSSLSSRIATVIVSATNLPSQTIVISQSGAPKTLAVTAGGLATALTATELATVTNFVLTGTIDARDFKTMRDNMPLLSMIDLSGVTIIAYTGTEGTNGTNNISYPANTVPDYAYYNSNTNTGKTSLTSFVLPSLVTSIGNYAFQGCSGLTSFNITSSVGSIACCAFNNCSGINSISVPSSVTNIQTSAFLNFMGLISVDAGNPNYSGKDGVLYNKAQTSLLQCPVSKTGSFTIPSTVNYIGFNSFFNCSGLTSLIIPSSVKTIDVQSFWGCRGLTNMSIPSSVTSVGGGVFGYCSGLASVTIPSSVTSLGSQAFYYCSNLSKIYTLETSPVNLSSSADVFYNVNKATCTLYVPSGTKAFYTAANQWQDFANIVEMAEFKLSATSANIAASGGTASVDLTTSLSWTAASDQTWLTVNPLSGTGNQNLTFTATTNPFLSERTATVTVSTIDIPPLSFLITQSGAPKTLAVTAGGLATALTATELATVTNLVLTGTIDARDFKTMRDNTPLLSMIDLSGVTIIAYTGTEGTNGTNNISYPANTVPDYAYYNSNTNTGKTSLTSFVLPSLVTSIGNYAFQGCSGLTSFNITSSVGSIACCAFNNCSGINSISVPSSVTNIQTSAFLNFMGLISVDAGNPNYSGKDGVLYNKAQTSLLQCPVSKTGSFTIPSTVNYIGFNSFFNCSGLTSLIIPSSVKTIDVQSFWGCRGLTNMLIPSSVTSVGGGVFGYCSGLASVTIPSSVTSLGSQAFYYCSNLSKIYTLETSPVNLSSSADVFYNVNKASCTLYVPSGTKAFYTAANQWQDFANIVEMAEFRLSANSATIAAAGGTASVDLLTSLSWTASSDQTWLTANSLSGTGNKSFTFTAGANPAETTRMATVNISAADAPSLTFLITQQANSSPVANAGTDQSVDEGALITLDGSKSSDPDSNAITYKWTAPTGISLSSDTDVKPTFTAPDVIANTDYIFSLVVNDGAIDSPADQVVITVNNISHPTHFVPVWSGNGFDHMNINIYSVKLDGADLENGDEIGIFDGSICVGVGVLTGTVSQTNTLNIAVSRDDGAGNGYAPGDAITFQLFDASKNLENDNVTAFYSSDNTSWSADGKFAADATAFAALTGLTTVNQDIAMTIGWNIISTYAVPANLDLKAIFQPLIDTGKLKKVMDEAGKTIENFGAFGGWKNSIGNLNSAKGYKVNLTGAATLSLTGPPVKLPFDLALTTGWNIISYPCATAQDAKALVQPLIDLGKLKKVMDEAGKTIENFGAFGGWKNGIGNFQPGKGYKVNVSSNYTLTVNASASKAAVFVPEVLASTHFAKVYSGNGTDHFNVHLVDLASSGLQPGDEIGIFDGKYCVGAAMIGSDQMTSGMISIASSANDDPSDKVNGFTVGHPVTLQLYREGKTYKLSPVRVSGDEAFEKNGSILVKVTASDLQSVQIYDGADKVMCYPNPCTDHLTIDIQLSEPRRLEVNIYDLTGKLIRNLFSGKAGTAVTLSWDGTNGNGVKMDSGTYILKANEMIEKVALKK